MSVPMRWQQPIEPQETARPNSLPQRRRKARRAQKARAFGVLCILMTVCTSAAIALRVASGNRAQQSALRLESAPAKGGRVALTGASVERNLGFVTVTGNVQNRTAQHLRNVEAVVELVDTQNRTVAVESALIGQDSLAGGGSAPFRVEMEDNAHAVSYRVHFRKLLGNSLD